MKEVLHKLTNLRCLQHYTFDLKNGV